MKRIGDNWRTATRLTLHNQVQVNHLPYMLLPATWLTYIPKDKLAAWFEATWKAGAELLTDTAFEGGAYDEGEGRWSVIVRQGDGKT